MFFSFLKKIFRFDILKKFFFSFIFKQKRKYTNIKNTDNELLLEKYFIENKNSQTKTEVKKQLSIITGLDITTIGVWLANRQRQEQKKEGKM